VTGRLRGLLAGPGPVLVLVVAAAFAGALADGLTDLHVYQHAGAVVLDGGSLAETRDPVTGLPFTYPPFAALVLVPLAWVPFWVAAACWTATSVAALAAVIAVALRWLDRPSPGWLVALLTLGAIGLEPVWQNLTFGQVNLLLMLAVLVDLLRPERRWAGLLLGIAAGVKLTPLVFVVLLVLVGSRSAAVRALLVFAATIALGFIVAPGFASAYWGDRLLDAARVGPPALAHNQSAYGALTRLLDAEPPALLWLVVAGSLSLVALVVAARWWLRGDRLLGTGLGAVAMLVVSPIAWSHHWVWALPLALALWERSRVVSFAWIAVFVARPFVWLPYGEAREYGWSWAEHLVGNAYLIAAIALVAWAGVQAARATVPGNTVGGQSQASSHGR
jgi:alpha-1,2-mannosyltransferase